MAGKKITGRTKQLSLKATPEFHQKLKELATEKKCLMIEIIEQAVAEWEKQGQKKVAKPVKSRPKLGDDKRANKENTESIISPEQVSQIRINKRPLDEDNSTEEPNTNSKKRKIDD